MAAENLQMEHEIFEVFVISSPDKLKRLPQIFRNVSKELTCSI